MSTDFQDRRVDIYNDGIGGVALIQHMGDDLTVVNAAESFSDKVSTEWSEREERLSSFLVREGHTSTVDTQCHHLLDQSPNVRRKTADEAQDILIQ